VLSRDGRVVSCLDVSDVLNEVPIVSVEFVFVAPEIRKEAEEWLQKNRPTIILPAKEEGE
jgi:hypothetical protein